MEQESSLPIPNADTITILTDLIEYEVGLIFLNKAERGEHKQTLNVSGVEDKDTAIVYHRLAYVYLTVCHFVYLWNHLIVLLESFSRSSSQVWSFLSSQTNGPAPF